MMPYSFDPTILRAYDIRGIFEQTLSLDDAFNIGLTFVSIQRARGYGNKVAVGRDGRLSSPALAEALIDGLVAGGAEVMNIGCGPTPMLYFAGYELATGGAIQITGSHNPPTHNGFKMVMGGMSFFGEDIQLLGKESATGVERRSGGSVTKVTLSSEYVARISKGMSAEGLSIVWDCGNGAAGDVMLDVAAGLSGDHKVLFPEIDGTFPNHHPNPVDPETLAFLRAEVADRKADLGIGFDGDGDRIGIVDAKGRQVPGDLLTAYLARDVAKRHPDAPILLDVKSSDTALGLLKEYGASPQIWKTGHSHMKKRMKETGAPLAGEMSGHIFIADNYLGFDDAIYAGLRVVTQMVETEQSITAFMDSLPEQHATPEMHIACPDTEKFGAIDAIRQAVMSAHKPKNVSDIDGVRVRTDTGWWLIRASNTEAALVARAEATTQQNLAELLQEMSTVLNGVGLDWSHSH